MYRCDTSGEKRETIPQTWKLERSLCFMPVEGCKFLRPLAVDLPGNTSKSCEVEP